MSLLSLDCWTSDHELAHLLPCEVRLINLLDVPAFFSFLGEFIFPRHLDFLFTVNQSLLYFPKAFFVQFLVAIGSPHFQKPHCTANYISSLGGCDFFLLLHTVFSEGSVQHP